jgi:uncharacterized protein (DUF1697 family)
LNTYIALLRGVNVSGKNMIKMPLLVKTVEQMGLQAVRSYIQSGNLVFQASAGVAGELAGRIEAEIHKDFGLTVTVFVMEATTLQKVRDQNPFLHDANTDLSKLHVMFLLSEPDPGRVAVIDPDKYLPDTYLLKGNTIYLYCPGGYGNTKLTNSFFESKLKILGTTRNWNTVNKLVALAGL